MKERIVNEYEYDIEIFKNRLNVSFNKYSFKTQIFLYFLLTYIIILYISEPKKVILICALAIIILLLSIRVIKYLVVQKATKKAKKVIKNLQTKYIIEKDYLIINNIKKVPLNSIKSVSQNKKWIIIKIPKSPFIMLKKDSFTSSTAEECYKYLKSYIRNRKINQK